MADNIRRLREADNVKLEELAGRLARLGRRIAPDSIRNAEHLDDGSKRRRRIDVDDLVTLAIALGTTPNRLLLTDSDAPADLVHLTPEVVAGASVVWAWADGRARIENWWPDAVPHGGGPDISLDVFRGRSRPKSRHGRSSAAVPSTLDAIAAVSRVVVEQAGNASVSPQQLLDLVRNAFVELGEPSGGRDGS